MRYYETCAWAQGERVCGVDEVGRGCLAGPVVAAAVILPPHHGIEGIKDSKQLQKKQLVALAAQIIKKAHVGIGIVAPFFIDRYNIYQATKFAMRKAFMGATNLYRGKLSHLLIDAVTFHVARQNCIVVAKPKGESWSESIAAASIVAKVKRDQLMAGYARIFPAYAFERHFGYGTAVHQACLQRQGASCLHRTSFLKKFTLRFAGQQSFLTGEQNVL